MISITKHGLKLIVRKVSNLSDIESSIENIKNYLRNIRGACEDRNTEEFPANDIGQTIRAINRIKRMVGIGKNQESDRTLDQIGDAESGVIDNDNNIPVENCRKEDKIIDKEFFDEIINSNNIYELFREKFESIQAEKNKIDRKKEVFNLFRKKLEERIWN